MQTIETIIEDAVARGVARALAEHRAPPAVPDGPPTLTVKEAAGVVGVSLPVMYEMCRRSDCDFCLTVGRKRVVLRHKLLDWMDRRADGRKGTTI